MAMVSSEPQLSSQATTSIPTTQYPAFSNPRLPPLQTTSTYPQHNIALSSSPPRNVDAHNPILEEGEEEEDETGSETANEPVTPIDTHNTQEFHDESNGMLPNEEPNHTIFQQVNYKPPLLMNTAATPPPGSANRKPEQVPVRMDEIPAQTPTQQSRPTSSREPSIRRGISGFFRRSNSHITNVAGMSIEGALSADNMILPKEGRRMSMRRASAVYTPNTTRSNTPPSPTISTQLSTSVPEKPTNPAASQFLTASKQNRSSTGLKLRARFTGITFAQPEKKKQSVYQQRKRANSVELDAPVLQAGRHPTQLTHQPWALRPETGTGVKARRMSLNLPDDFTVDVAELNDEFEDQSKMIGRRGKSLGKGATSTVTIMYRKGCRGSTSDLFAVKRFVTKSKEDSVEEYQKKIKSEFSIAKSLHHPNIVETVRLCTHKGQWNHVMEYCSEGDLFSAVQKGYLRAREEGDRLVDRLCLFKQLMQGINYLHEHGIAHRDIKLENLLLTSQSKLKITDFGVSEIFCGIHPGLRAAGGECGKNMKEVRLCTPGICGSMPYIAPEVVSKQGEYDPRPLDVWSSAVVMIHIIFGGALWGKAEMGPANETYGSIVNGWAKWEAKHDPGTSISADDYPHVRCLDNVVNPPALRRLLLTMLHPDPKKRATTAEVVNNRWLKNVDCCQMDSYDDPTKIIDASVSAYKPKVFGVAKQPNTKVVHHNHLPPNPSKTQMHKLIRLPGSTDM